MSAVGPGAFSMMRERYLPSPSWVMPRTTFTPLLGTSQNFTVLFGLVEMASLRSAPTLFLSISIAATNSMSRTW